MSATNGHAGNGVQLRKKANGANGANGYPDQVKPHAVAAEIPTTKEAGVTELIICVLGIYGSLYVLPHLNPLATASSKNAFRRDDD
jgi:hypothetical protein